MIMAVSAALLAVSCQKGDGDVDYGNMLVYIPQATVSGGLDYYYTVPSGGAENTYNFRVDGDVVNVMLGVARSGKASGEAFSVEVVVDNGLTEKAVEALKATPLQGSAYTLPSKVEVEAGRNNASFYLAVKKSEIVAGTKYVLGVAIENPSSYDLAKSNTEVVVVIDSDALLKLI